MIFYHISKNTFKECLRQPVYFILLITALCLIGLFPSLAIFAFNEQLKMVADSSLAIILFLSVINAVFLADYAVCRDIESGILLLMMSKPVSRYVFITGKLTGILCALTVFVVICSIATLISLHIAVDQFNFEFRYFHIYFYLIFAGAALGCLKNYFFRTSFSSGSIFAFLILQIGQFLYMNYFTVIGRAAGFRGFELNVSCALILIIFAVWILGTLAVMLSVRLDIISNLIICFAVFMLGLVSDYFFLKSAVTSYFFKLIYALVPNWQFFWMADALANNKLIPGNYILWSLFYTILYIIACGCLAVILFERVETASVPE